MKLEDLQDRVGRLKGLLDDPHPGLYTWSSAVARLLGELTPVEEEVVALVTELKLARAVLRGLEWSRQDGCPVCHGFRPDLGPGASGHFSGCGLAALIGEGA